jgi:hypothetical protein
MWFDMRLLVALPIWTFVAAWYALRPIGPAVAPMRLATLRSAVVVGAYAIVSVEVLSVFNLVTRPGVCVVWLIGVLGATTAAVMRHRRGAVRPSRLTWPRLGLVEWLMVAGLVALAAGTLVLALAAEPDNWDSQAYHLPKVEQWVAARSVEIFPSGNSLQVAMGPGAEYLLLHLRLFTGGDGLYNMVQWGAGLLCAVAVSRVAEQLGAGRLGQLASAFVVVTTPMVALQATSTQTDLTVAAWCACAASFVVDAAWGRLRVVDVLLLGGALGLAQVTKSTGLMTAGLVMALWFVARAWRVRSARAAAGLGAAALGVVAVALVIAGPYVSRVTVTYANPLGPADVRMISMERQDPLAVTVNALRLMQTATMFPDDNVNAATAGAVKRLASKLGQDVGDPATTLADPFPLVRYMGTDEDFAPFPVQAVAVAAGLVFCLVWRRRDPRVLGYALTCIAVGIAFAALIKWQPFGNRLLLPVLVVAAPLAGLVVHALAQRARTIAPRVVVTFGLVLVVFTAGYGGVYTVLFGTPRPLMGTGSVLATDPWQTRFGRLPTFLPDYLWAADTVRAAGAQRIGLLDNEKGTRYEYPLWLLLRGRQLVTLRSVVPGHPAASSTSVQAIICFAPPPPTCAAHVPPGWTLQSHANVAVALPSNP